MSLKPYGVRKVLAAAGIAAMAACAAAAPANAAQLTQTYKCTYPLIGERALTVNIDAAIPAEWETGTPTPPFDISASAEADLGTYQGLDLIGANKISGLSKATSTVTAPNFTLPVVVPIAIPEVTKPAAPPLRFEGLTGETPSLTFTQAGIVNITVDKLDLNISAVRADGSAIVLPPVVPVDSDGNPNTFDVPCVLNPAGQDKTLQNIDVKDPVVEDNPPTAPTNLAGTPDTTSVDLSWTASEDDNGVASYDVYQDDVKVDTVPGTSTSVTIDGLTPETAYSFKVQAVDTADQTSPFSDDLEVSTLEEPDTPPTAPTDLAGTPTDTTVALSWTASTDDNGVAGYDVYQDDVKIETVAGTSTSTTVTGLTPETAYSFKVQAVDTADQTSPFSDSVSVTTLEEVQGPDTTPPTAPGEPFITSVDDVTSTSINLQWGASTDEVGVVGYEIRIEGETIEVGNVTQFLIEGLTPKGVYEIDVRAFDAAGNFSEYSPSIVLELPDEGTDEDPTAPGNLTGTATGETSVDLSWDAATDDVFVAAYEVFQDDVKVATITAPTTTATIDGLTAGTEYKFKVRALDAPALKAGPFSDEISVTTDGGVDAPPSAPTNVAGTPTLTTVALTWDASTDDDAVTGYDVYQDGVKIDTVTGTSKTVTGLTSSTAYKFKVQAIDSADQTSDFSDEVEVTTLTDQAPSTPSGLAGTPTATSVALSWTASTDDVSVAGYDVFQDGVKIDTVVGTSKTVTGLTPETAYTFTVQAVDSIGQTSELSSEVEVTTLEESTGTVAYGYDLLGNSKLKNLTRGTVPLSGGIDADLELATGDFEADLLLNKTRARLSVLGLLPITADIDFAQADKTRGKLAGGVLTATSKFKIKIPKAYLFGILPIVGSSSCETKSASIATLKSTGSFFDPLQGGNLQGTYGISDLRGCGWLNNVISPLTKGGGNTIDINLTPKAPAAS